MSKILVILADLFIVGLFLYSKLLPYKDRLNPQYKGIFHFFDQVFTPVFAFLRKYIKPVQVAPGISIDATQFLLLALLVIILNLT